MSSSRIIKSQPVEGGSESLPSFNFRPIGQRSTEQSGGFVPMGLFDPSELQGRLSTSQESEPDPDSVVLSEEEFNRRLRDSFEKGLAEGKNLAERGLFNVFRALRTSSETIHALREKVLRESEDEILKLIMLVARKVILREVSQNRDILTAVVRHAIAGLSERDEITVRLNPDDYALVTTGRENLLNNELASERLHIKPDPSVQSGFCLVDTEMGTINASVDAQLDEIYRRLLEERGNTPEEKT